MALPWRINNICEQYRVSGQGIILFSGLQSIEWIEDNSYMCPDYLAVERKGHAFGAPDSKIIPH